MKRILGGLVTYFMYFCVATVFAQALVFAYVWMKVDITPEKVRRIAQIAYDLEEKPADMPIATDLAEPDTGSIAQVVEARAMGLRDMEFREQALKTLASEINSQRQQLTAEDTSLDLAQKTFEERLSQWQDAQRTAAIDDAVALIAGMKAPQAKEEVKRMWSRGEKDFVVSLVKSLPQNNRTKLVAEFKNDDESQILSEIIRLMREGVPEIRLAEEVNEILMDSTQD
ncbi:MAG: hypothetical protein MPJ50_10185 [Pirellulales bacterium]|nr:hypothetical protein [Pirellulales bacterium]